MPPLVRPLDGSIAETEVGRLFDLVFGVDGACTVCLPRRVPAEYLLVWEITQAYLDEVDDQGGDGPSCSLYYLCRKHVAEHRSDPDPLLPIVLVRSLRS